ncbi:caspase family protein [Streptomyces phaeochromogenes]|uniref:caspase family protein n=1 Tax=Streptomyces phaeochromogenes TaxID=1923 RepID=UPI00341058BE
MSRRLAMLIATYEYQDSTLLQLTTPAHDAEPSAAVLKDPAIAGFEVTTLVNQPHHRVGEAIGDFYRNRRRDDLTLLYFTGHGMSASVWIDVMVDVCIRLEGALCRWECAG